MDGLTAIPLELIMECTATKVQVETNIAATFERGYEPLMRDVDDRTYVEQFSGAISICGSGPSLEAKHGELVGDVLAVNGAIKFLLDRGIVPRFGMLWDADAIIAEFATPHPDITYLVASRCNPAVFAALDGCKIIVWHAGGDHDIEKILGGRGSPEPMVLGGTTGVTRGMFLAYALGYKEFHLFGADSCYAGEATHIAGASKVPENMIHIRIADRWFESTPQWAAQIEEIKLIYPLMTGPHMGATITAHDDGLMAWVVGHLRNICGAAQS